MTAQQNNLAADFEYPSGKVEEFDLLTWSKKCCCVYSLTDSLMFFSQSPVASIFFLVEQKE